MSGTISLMNSKALFLITLVALLASIAYLVVSELRRQDSSSQSAELVKRELPQRTPYLVKTLIDPSKHLDEQIEAVRALPSDLTEGEFEALIAILYEEVPETMDTARWSTIQNEIMEVLRQRRFNLDEYSSAIAGILGDREANPIMRDYAAQHLTRYLTDRGTSLSPEITEQTMKALIAILDGEREASQQVAGTTLMALCDLNRRQPDLLKSYRPQLSSAIQRLLNPESQVTLSNRVSAIQAAGRLQLAEVLPQIRTMAQSDTIKPTFKLSSIAALGYYASPQDQAFLEQLAQGQTRFRFAAQTALKNF